MPVYTGLRAVTGAGIELLRRVDALPVSGTVGEKVVLKSTGIVYEWTGAWTSLGPAVPTTPSAISAGTTMASSGTVAFANSNNVSFGLSGQTITASVGGGGGGVAVSAGTVSVSSGTVVFSNSNGVSFGLSGSTVTASVAAGPSAGIAGLGAGTQTATSGTVAYAASNGLSFGLSGSSQITGSHDGFRSVSGGTTHALGPSLSLADSNGLSFGVNGSTITASYTVPSTAGLLSAIRLSAGTASSNLTAFELVNGSGVSFGLDVGSKVTASVAAGATATGNLGGIAAGGSTATSGTVALGNANGLSFGFNGQTITGSYTVPSTAGLLSAVNLSAGTTSQNASAFVFSNGGNVTFGLNGSTITASAPSGGGGGVTLSSYEPFPFVANTGTAIWSQSTATSAPIGLFPVQIDTPVAAELMGVVVSMSFQTGGTSSFRQSATLRWGLYTRPTGASSTQLNLLQSDSLSYAVTYNNSTISISQVTTTNVGPTYGYGQTTSAGLAISSGYTGLKLLNLDIGTTLTAGQYWLGIQHINSSSSFNSGIRMSFYGSAHTLTGLAPMGSFSSAFSTGTNVAGGLGGNLYLGLGSYSVAALTSLPATISLSQVTQAGINFRPYLRFSTRVT
jgi:mucin-19